jgi:hypothetical protein
LLSWRHTSTVLVGGRYEKFLIFGVTFNSTFIKFEALFWFAELFQLVSSSWASFRRAWAFRSFGLATRVACALATAKARSASLGHLC